MMKAFLSIIFGMSFLACVNAVAMTTQEDVSPTWIHFQKMLRLIPGQSAACEEAIGNKPFRVRFAYYLLPQESKGDGSAVIYNPSDSPIYSELYMQGMDDRYGFGHYYLPAMPFTFHHVALALRGVVLNICMNRQDPSSQRQAELMITLPSGELCLVRSSVWDSCR